MLLLHDPSPLKPDISVCCFQINGIQGDRHHTMVQCYSAPSPVDLPGWDVDRGGRLLMNMNAYTQSNEPISLPFHRHIVSLLFNQADGDPDHLNIHPVIRLSFVCFGRHRRKAPDGKEYTWDQFTTRYREPVNHASAIGPVAALHAWLSAPTCPPPPLTSFSHSGTHHPSENNEWRYILFCSAAAYRRTGYFLFHPDHENVEHHIAAIGEALPVPRSAQNTHLEAGAAHLTPDPYPDTDSDW